MGKFFNGRILVTDYAQAGHTVIENIINHPSSRAAVYVLLNDFKSVPEVLRKFPTIIPVVNDPSLDKDELRKTLNLLPHMDHYVNFLGDQVAQEFLARRETFRIKSVSFDYITDSQRVIDKIIDSSGQQGIIFNVSYNNDANCLDTLVQETSKQAIKQKTKKFFSKFKSKDEGSDSEREQLLPRKEQDSRSHPSTSANTLDRRNDTECSNSPSSGINSFWLILVAIFRFCCPCFKSRKPVTLPPNRYPPDLDEKMQAALQQLHNKADEKWSNKLFEFQDRRSEAYLDLEVKIDEWKKKELPKAIAKYDDDNKTTLERNFDSKLKEDIVKSRHNRAVGDVNRKSRELLEQGKLEVESEYSEDELWSEHYEYVSGKQIYKLEGVWLDAMGVGCFG